MKNLVKQFQSISHRYDLWGRNSKIVIGVSGGPDSVCLLDIFSQLKKTYALDLIVAHVNYGLRGKDSDEDENFVRSLAEKYSVKIEVLRAKKTAAKNLENRLRDIRYDFFEKIRQENGFDLVAVAHNLDDQAETFLMRILRGAGLQGLSAMKHKNGRIIRPLLDVPRKEILNYLDSTDKAYRTDRTNAENLFLRNRIRNKLIPYLEKNYNPNIKRTISDSIASISDDHACMDELAEKAYQKNKGLPVKKILSLHPALQRRVLLQAIAEKKQDRKDIGMSHIEEMLKAMKSTKGKNQTVSFQGLKMMRKGDKVTISKL